MTEIINITHQELFEYAEKQKRGELTITRMKVLKENKGYEITISDLPYQTFAAQPKTN